MAKAKRKRKVTDGPVFFCRMTPDTHKWLHRAAGRNDMSASKFGDKVLTMVARLDEDMHAVWESGTAVDVRWLGMRMAFLLRAVGGAHPDIEAEAFEMLRDVPPEQRDAIMGRNLGKDES